MSSPTDPLNALAEKINAWAIEQGFYNPPRELDSHLMLIVSEAAEALEHWRDGHDPTELFWTNGREQRPGWLPWPEMIRLGWKPDGVPIELADILIRTLDTMAHYRLDVDDLVEIKMAYNRTRAARNGGKRT